MASPAHAEDEGTSFYVMPVLPDNQLPSTSEYYHLQTDQDLNQTIELMIINDSDEDKTFKVTILDGMTTDLGEISYDTKHAYDKSQKIKLSEEIKVEENQTVKAKETGLVKLQLAISTADFSGQLLGAVNVYEQTKQDEQATGVINQFAYNIPIKVDVKTSQIVASLAYEGLKITKKETKSALTVGYSNPSATIIRELALSYQLFSEKDHQLVMEQKETKLEMAPNSKFSPSIFSGKPLKAGKYRLEIRAVSEISNINESWQEEFTITGKESKALNEGLTVERTGLNWYYWVGLLIIGIGTLVYGYRYYKKRKRK